MGSAARLLDTIYPHLPVPLQTATCFLYGLKEKRLRYGHGFERSLRWLRDTEWWSKEQIRAYQNSRLRSIVERAYETVPFYRRRMSRMGISPSDVRTVADLKDLPITTKQDVRQHGQELLSSAVVPRQMVACHTSGTTGTGLHFYQRPETVAFRWAIWWRHRARFGVAPGDRHANFTGKQAVPSTQVGPPYWRECAPLNQLVFSMQQITEQTIRDIVRRLGDESFAFYSGYPSILLVLSQLAMQLGLEVAQSPEHIFTGAENVTPVTRRDIESFSGAVVRDQYGFAEGCGNAAGCPEGVYHEDFELGVVECVDPEPAGEDGAQTGRVVCTSLVEDGFPLIRYDVGDRGTWAGDGTVCRCGRKSKVIAHIDGREEDFVVTPEGRRIMRFDYLFKDTMSVAACQVVQERRGAIVLRIVPTDSYQHSVDEHRLRKLVAEWISPTLTVGFEYLRDLPRERNGKFRPVKSYLDNP